MAAPNYYEVLGVPEQASTDHIKARYANLLKDLRARLASGTPADPDVLDQLRIAFQTLTNAAARLAYDRQLRPAAEFAGIAPKDRQAGGVACPELRLSV